ncbi:MAG: hypothetical protein PHV30_01625 [Candidatus Margulisbacteria bacterium]|nr:hypothetical protein [Candidatus Margulisiibacteriota bacterium]
MRNKFAFWSLILGGALLFGAPSAIGTNGLINMPTAMSIQYKAFDLGSNWTLVQNNSSSAQNQIHYYGNLGIFEGVELGFLGNNQTEGVFLNLKYYMLSDKSNYPLGLAVGLTNISSHSNSNLYLVLSKKFPNQLTGHFGFASNILATKIQANVMFGLEMPFSNYVNAFAELIGSQDSWVLSAGTRLKLADDLLLNAYWDDIGNSSAGKSTFSLGISWHGILQ